jgi:hypothetical protein
MNWDALGSIADAVSALVAVGALILAYLAYKKSPQLVERVGQSLEDQRKLAEAEAWRIRSRAIETSFWSTESIPIP